MKFKLNPYNCGVTDEEIIADLQRVAKETPSGNDCGELLLNRAREFQTIQRNTVTGVSYTTRKWQVSGRRVDGSAMGVLPWIF